VTPGPGGRDYVRYGLSHIDTRRRPQAFATRRARIAVIACIAVSALLWFGLYSIIR
jgi:hypothetical protein